MLQTVAAKVCRRWLVQMVAASVELQMLFAADCAAKSCCQMLQMVTEKVRGSWLLQMFAASVEFQMLVGADL